MQHPEHRSISMETLERTAAALRVLAHPHRLKLVELLDRKRLSVGELAEALKLSPAACSQHLNRMRAHGLLRAVRRGRTIYYSIANPSARNVIQCIRRHET